MNEKFLDGFIDFLEEYLDEEIVKDEKYRELRHKCSVLSREGSEKEYKTTCEELDYLYRRLLCKKIFLLTKSFYR